MTRSVGLSLLGVAAIACAGCGHPGFSSQRSAQLPGVAATAGGGSSAQSGAGRGSSSCDTSHWNGTPCPPEPPKPYTIPAHAVRVTNSSELKNALADAPARDIVLVDGTYDNPTYFHALSGHRLWAENLGGATLKAGLLCDKAPGNEVHGIKFDVSDTSKTSHHAIVYTVGAANSLTVTDSWFEGHMSVSIGLYIQAIDGVKLERLVISHFQRQGIFYRDTSRHTDRTITPNPPPLIADIDVSYIRHPDPACCRGTAEFGIDMEDGAPGALVERVKCRYADWSCLIPAHNSSNIAWRDIDVDYTNDYGFYFEHWSDNNVLERFRIGPHVQSGIAFEAAQKGWGWKPAGNHNTVRNGYIETSRIGVGVGACNGNLTVENVTFVGQCYAAIVDNGPLYNGRHCTAVGPNRFTNNDYSRIDAGAQTVMTNRPTSGSRLCGSWDPW